MTLEQYKEKTEYIKMSNSFFFLDIDTSNSLNDHDVFKHIEKTDDHTAGELYNFKNIYSDFFYATCILLQLDGKYLVTPADRLLIKNASDCIKEYGLEMLYQTDKLNSAANEDPALTEIQKGYIKRYLRGVQKEVFNMYQKAKAAGI